MATRFKRADYLSGTCTHREYYAQFVTDHIRDLIAEWRPPERLAESTCEHFNDVPLSCWDRISPIASVADKKLRDLGDAPTLAGRVCILKEAARQLREEHNDVSSN
tara:strand:- start:587 stop:904 length:318 start_codon:yes stop_codon:yes gene_type:complete